MRDVLIISYLPTDTVVDLVEILRTPRNVVVYYRVDNLALLTPHDEQLRRSEAVLIKSSDLVFANSQALSELPSSMHGRVHIGTFCIPLAGFTGERGKVYAFEGNPDNYALLEKNIRANNLQERIQSTCAVVSETGNSFIRVLPTGGNSGMYYFAEASGAGMAGFDSVNVGRWLDKNAPGLPIHLIKIDIEGAEVSALRSCAEVIKKYRPIIYCEINRQALKLFKCSPANIESILNSFGYGFFRNAGQRNSDNDEYRITRLKNLKEGGTFFDVLAIHPSSERYPKEY
jgi:FkbM family methyltransferase